MEQNHSQLEKTERERVRLLYSNARFSIAGIFLGSLFFFLFFLDSVPPLIWIAWIALILAVNIPRLFLIKAFHKYCYQELLSLQDIKKWEQLFFIGVIFSSLSWSVVSLFPFQGDLLLSLAFTTLTLIAMSSASIITLITSLKMGLTFLTVTMLPLVARSLLMGEFDFYVLAMVGLSYYIIFTQMACRLHHAIMDNIHLNFENEELSLKDTLTGLWNRRQLYLFVEQLQSQAERNAGTFSVILMDLDYFKHYNDTQGHNAGDMLLVKVAGIIMHESRDEDLAVRYGGEEFVVVLPRAGVEQAAQLAERIRKHIERITGVTVSAGIVGYTLNESFEQMMGKADEALYRAKSQGRNRIILYGAADPKSVMTGTSLPQWVEWVAQDRNGSWWGFEHEPNEGDCSWYENEVGRYIRLSDGNPNPNWQQTLQRRPLD